MAETSISVVMAVRNGAATIKDSVAAIEAQDADVAEIVIAAAPSDDGTGDVLRSIAEHNAKVRIVPNPTGTTPAGLNLAIRESSGDIVARVDAHSILPPGYVSAAAAALERSGADVVGGIQDPIGETFTERGIAAAMRSRFGSGGAAYRGSHREGATDTVYLGVFLRSALDRTGGYDETMLRNQDYELNHRIRSTGGTVWLDPGLRVHYRPRSSLAALWRQYFAYGRGKRHMLYTHPGSVRFRQLVPPLFVLALITSAVLAVMSRATPAAVVPAAYAIAALLATVYEAARRPQWALLLTPAAFTVMHVAWGLGFLIEPARSARSQPAASR